MKIAPSAFHSKYLNKASVMALNSHPLSQDDYAGAVFNLLRDAEGLDPPSTVPPNGPFKAYYDEKGLITIGVGFNIGDPQNVYDVLITFGLPDTKSSPDDSTGRKALAIANYVAAHSNVNLSNQVVGSDIQNTLDSYLKNSNGTPLYHQGTFQFLDENEAINAFKRIYPRYEAKILSSIQMPFTREEVTLLSLQYNSQAKNPLIGPHLISDIQNGNRAEAWYEIRENSNGGAKPDQGVARRRYVESQVFDLYGSEADPSGRGTPLSIHQFEDRGLTA